MQKRLFQPTVIFQNGIFQNGIFQNVSFRKYFQPNRNLLEWNLLEGIFQNKSFRNDFMTQLESFRFKKSFLMIPSERFHCERFHFFQTC
jgi:hypothetical protein